VSSSAAISTERLGGLGDDRAAALRVSLVDQHEHPRTAMHLEATEVPGLLVRARPEVLVEIVVVGHDPAAAAVHEGVAELGGHRRQVDLVDLVPHQHPDQVRRGAVLADRGLVEPFLGLAVADLVQAELDQVREQHLLRLPQLRVGGVDVLQEHLLVDGPDGLGAPEQDHVDGQPPGGDRGGRLGRRLGALARLGHRRLGEGRARPGPGILLPVLDRVDDAGRNQGHGN
jgi:hypothetical protein